MDKLLPGTFWLSVLLSSMVWQFTVDGAPVTGIATSRGTGLRNHFGKTLSLSRRLLNKTKSLTHDYKELKLKNSYLDHIGNGPELPSVAIDFTAWLMIKPGERLRELNRALQVYPTYLEQLIKWMKEEGSKDIERKANGVRNDLRDLLHHIRRQMQSLGISPLSPLTPNGPQGNGNDWCSQVQMYQALRSLEQTLSRAVRDYTLLHHDVKLK